MGSRDLRAISAPTEPGHFSDDHPLHHKRYYWPIYVSHVYEAIETLGVPLRPQEMGDFVLEWDFNGEIVQTLVCYSDKSWQLPSVPDGVRAIFKMRYHPTRNTVESSLPIFAAGFGMGMPYNSDQITGLRRIKDTAAQLPEVLYTMMSFRVLHKPGPMEYPNRERFRAALGPCRNPLRFNLWLEAVARSRATLNLCGSGNSIDSKIPQLCAIGTAIISDRGLETLALPWGECFVHGENIWFIDEPEDLPGALDALQDDTTWRRLVEGSRRLYERAFHPRSVGQWYKTCAEAVLDP